MANKKRKVITKKDWLASFNLVGEVKINDFTFKIDEKAEKSDWIYNSMNLGIDTGEKSGIVYANMMGGYSEERDSVIYAHGKKADGTDDFEQRMEIAWEDRFDEDILDSVGDFSFITVGIEKTDKGKTFYKKFLSAYDAIAYMNENLEDGMVVNVRGQLKYSIYQDNVQVQKNITSIALSKAEPEDYRATFTQTILLNKQSVNMKENCDKDKGVVYVDAQVLDYVKEIHGIEVKGQYPFEKTFEFKMDFDKPELCKKIYDKLFKVKKDVTQITFEGEFIEGGAMVTATWDDVPDDIKDLVECGIYTKEEALKRCSSNGNRESRMVLCKPHTKLVGDEKNPVLQIFTNQYTEDELILDYLYDEDGFMDIPEDSDDEIPFDKDKKSKSDSDDMSWLDDLE